MKQVGVFFLLLLCLGSWLETVVGGCGGGTGAECPVKATDFKQVHAFLNIGGSL